MIARLEHRSEGTYVKDRLGDQRGRSEWEPIKILLQGENSAYTPKSQPRIPTRPWGGRSAVIGRTVRYPRADGPLITTE
jgi:hypothetical protein